MVIGFDGGLALPMEGSLPPDLQGMLFRVGPGQVGGGGDSGGDPDGDGDGDGDALPRRSGALHAIELRDGKAVSYLRQESEADAGVFWHAGSLLALPEVGLPSRYTRFLEPQEFVGGLRVPVASHAHRVAADGSRVLFTVDDLTRRVGDDGVGEVGSGRGSGEPEGIWLRIGEWDVAGALHAAQSVELERATWQHDIGVTSDHVVFIESPTTRLPGPAESPVPFGWVPGVETWMGVVRRDGEGGPVRWFRLDPCLVTHVLGAWETGRDGGGSGGGGGGGDGHGGEIELLVCCYGAPEPGQRIDLTASVLGPEGIGRTAIGGSLAILEHWRIIGDRVERVQVDERHVEYPRTDPLCEGTAFRYGYCVEMAWTDKPSRPETAGGTSAFHGPVSPSGLLKVDVRSHEVTSWNPGRWRKASEPLFVRATDGRGDDEGWLLTVIDDANTGTSDLCVLDASSMARHRPEAIIHLPERLPLRSHGEWVPADRYR